MRTKTILSTLALAVALAACGDDGSPVVADPPDATPTTAAPAAPPATDELPIDETPDDTPAGETPIEEPTDTGPDGPILGAGLYPIADLTFDVTLDADGAPVTHRLACLGDTATLTGDAMVESAEVACLALADLAVRTRLLEGEPTDQACTEIYGGPQVATISGTLDGEDVATDLHRTNGCGIADWDLLAGLLPAV